MAYWTFSGVDYSYFRPGSTVTDTEHTGELLDIILCDDADRLADFLSSFDNPDRPTNIATCRMPPMLRGQPPISALCAFFGAVECFNYFVMTSFNDKVQDRAHRTLAHFAAAGGNMEIIRALEALDHSFDAIDSVRFTPVHYAAQMGHIHVVQWLWSKGLAFLESFASDSPFSVACLMGHLDRKSVV
jgi:hypothetical protein